MSDQLASWLKCPVCGRDLEPTALETLGCSSGHRFDINKRGYAGLLTGRSTGAVPATAVQLDALDTVFATGLFASTTEAVGAVLPRSPDARVLDAGSAAGLLIGSVMSGRPQSPLLSVSDSPPLVARSMRNAGGDGLLCDTSREWSVRDGTADAVVDLLGTHRPAEFHRILAPGGVFVAAVAGYDHLAELRPPGEYPEWRDTVAELIDDVFPWFEHDQSRTVTERHPVPTQARAVLVAARDLVGGTATPRAISPESDEITVDLTVIRFRRRRRQV